MTAPRSSTATTGREFARQRAFVHLDALTAADGGSDGTARSPVEEQQLAQAVLDALFGLGRLQALVDDERIENIDVNGCDRVWATFADGSKRLMDPVADSDDELVDLLRSAAGRFGLTERRFDTARPELDLQLPGGARLSAVMAVSRPDRRCRSVGTDSPISRSTNCAPWGRWTTACGSLLSAAVRARKNIVVSGAMNSGQDHPAAGPRRRDRPPRAHRDHRAGVRARSRHRVGPPSRHGGARGPSGQYRGRGQDPGGRPGAPVAPDERRPGDRRRGPG